MAADRTISGTFDELLTFSGGFLSSLMVNTSLGAAKLVICASTEAYVHKIAMSEDAKINFFIYSSLSC